MPADPHRPAPPLLAPGVVGPRGHRLARGRAAARRAAGRVARRRRPGALPQRPVHPPGHGPLARRGGRRLPRVPVPRVAVRRRRRLRPHPAAPGRRPHPAHARRSRATAARSRPDWSGSRSTIRSHRSPPFPEWDDPAYRHVPVPHLHVGDERAPHGRELHRLRPPRLAARRPARHQGRPRGAAAPGPPGGHRAPLRDLHAGAEHQRPRSPSPTSRASGASRPTPTC